MSEQDGTPKNGGSEKERELQKARQLLRVASDAKLAAGERPHSPMLESALTPVIPSPSETEPSQAEVDAYIASIDAQKPVTIYQPRIEATEGAATVKPSPEQPETEFRFIFPSLGKGKRISFRSENGKTVVISKVVRKATADKPAGKGSEYRITEEGVEGIRTISLTEIRRRGQAEGWKLVGEEVGAEPSAEAFKPFLEKENEEVLFVGKSSTHKWNRIVRVRTEYFFVSPDGTQTGPNTEAEIRNAAKSEEWQIVTDDTEYRRANGLLASDSAEPTLDLDLDLGTDALESEGKYELKADQVWETPWQEVEGRKGKDRCIIKSISGQNATIHALVVNAREENIFSREYSYSLERLRGILQDRGFIKVADTAVGIDLSLKENDPENASPEIAPIPSPELGEEDGGFLKEGETAEFTMDNMPAGSTRRFKREGGLYRQIRPDGTIGDPYTEEEIRELAARVGLKRVVAPAESRPESVASELETLPEGTRASYVNQAGEEVTVERKGTRYQITDSAGDDSGFIYDVEWMKRIAAEEGWRRKEGDSKSAEVPEKNPALTSLEEEIARCWTKVEDERQAYLEKEQEQEGAWKRLGKIFRGIKPREEDKKEVAQFEYNYKNALFRWKNASLERLRYLNLDGDELRQEMAGLIREIEFEEAERLYDERQKLRMERISKPMRERIRALWNETSEELDREKQASRGKKAWSTVKVVAGTYGILGGTAVSKTLAGVDKIGEGYNKLARGKHGKLILAATVAGAGAAAFGTGGATVVGALALKRLAAGAGFAVTARGIADRYVDNRRKKKKENFLQEDRVQEVMDRVSNETADQNALGQERLLKLDALSAYLDKEGIAKVQSKARRRKVFEVWRKGGAYLAGAAVGGLIPREWLTEAKLPFSSAHAAADAHEGAAVPVRVGAAASAPLEVPADTLPSTASVEGGNPVSHGSQAEGEGRVTAPLAITGTERVSVERTAPLEVRVKDLAAPYTVKTGDSIWKIAKNSVEDLPDMDKRSTARFAKLLEQKLEGKLSVIDPKLAAAAGFTPDASGQFTPRHIELGAKLELGKLIPADEMAKLIEEAKGDSPITLASAHVPMAETAASPAAIPLAKPAGLPTPAELIAQDEARITAAVPSIGGDERAATPSLFQEPATRELIKTDGNVMKYIQTLPREEQERLFRNFKRLTASLLMTSEGMERGNFTAAETHFLKTKVASILSDHDFSEKSFASSSHARNPFSLSQREGVVRFARAAAKSLGQSVAAPKTAESIQEYALRMVAIALNQDVKIPGMRMVK